MNQTIKYFIILLVKTVHISEECDFIDKSFFCEESESLMFEYNSKDHSEVEEMKFSKLNYSIIKHFLANIEDNVKEQVKIIRIAECEVEDVSEDISSNYPELKILDLSENNIENLDFVTKLPEQLEELYLRKNNISTIPEVFTHLKMLKVIDLSGCNIESVNFIVFKNNLHLILVNASYNNIEISESEEYLKNIECVDLSYNKLKKYSNIPSLCLDFSYTDMTGYRWYNIPENNRTIMVEKFYFSGNRQLNLLATNVKNETVPMVIKYLNLSYFKGNLSELCLEKVKIKKLLTLTNSKIENLDKSSYDFQKLFYIEGTNATLDLSNCSIKYISENYFQNYDLGRLNLCYNNFKTLKNGVFKNSYIVQLDLCHSQIYIIENEAFLGLHVSILNISNNHLEDLQFLQQITTVRSIDLSNNNIKSIYLEELRNLKDLTHINLSYNKIISIPTHSFSLNNIKLIDLSNNNIKQIKNGTFVNIQNLEELYLQSNNIEIIDDDAFQYLPVLQKVDLRGTSIYGIKKYAFNVGSSYFNKIYLKHNEISNLQLVCELFRSKPYRSTC
ncbi:toll-like receptor 8 [Diorhabda sublineata]|uniref:toll-like receptor 8 n=1 Tax=Diorhabda sublineata TaxID=1163346 RepID=UPI0024E11102|nr:toll-like receptor 8 [Diorhabda sublineata]